MAEDLKIRVKVEPNTTGLQGKLDEAAKKYKLNIELFDEKSLVSQISNVQTKLNTLINNTAHKLTTLSANAQQNTATIAAGMRSLIDTYGDVADIQKEISSNAKGLNLIDQTKIEESKSKIAELKKELEDLRKTQKQGNSYKSDFVGTVLGEEGFDADAVGKSLQDVLNRMKNVAGKGANEIKAEIASIFNDSSDIDSLALMNTINDIFYDMDGELDDFKKKYGDAYTELFKINGAIGLDKKESGYPASLVKTASKYADDLTRIYEQIQTSVNNISKGTEVKTNLTNLIDSLQQFYKVSGFLNNGENFSDKENAITAKIDKEQAKIDALLQKSGSSAENAGKDAGSKYVKAFSEVVTKNINQDLDLESLVGKTFDLNGLLEKAFGSDTKIGVIENYKKNLQSELAQIASQTEKMFDVDLTTLDNDSAKNISTLKSNAIAVRTVMDDISKLLERTKGGVGNNEEYEQFKTYLQQLQGYVSNIKEVYNSVDSINSGELTIKNDSDDKLTERASKLEESMRRLVQLQLSLTLEKVKTLEAENDIIGATSKNSDVLKTALEKQREITKTLNSDSGKSGKTDNKPDSKAAKEAENSSGKAKENLQDAAAAVKELKTKGLDTVLKTVQKFVDGVCSDQSKVSAVSDKISEFNTKMAGFESAVTNYCKAITDLNTYFEQNAAILSALKGAYDIDSAQEKNKVKKETEQQTSAKITALLNKVNASSEKIVSAVNDASNALKEISTALSAAAESAGSINGDGQVVLGAIQKLDTIFQQYSKALNNAGILNAADKPADEKTVTTKKRKTKKKETITEPTDTVSASIKKMEAVFDEFTAVAEATTGFAGKVDAVISAGDSIKEIIAKFNSIGDGSAESAQKTVEDQQAAIQEISAQVKSSKTALAKSDSGIQQATTAVQEAVESASSIDTDAQALIKAGKVLSSIFKAYAKILDELQDSVDKVSGVDAKTITTSMTKMKNFVKNTADTYAEAAEKATAIAKADKKTVKKEKTEKADAQKADTKPTASIDTDKLNQAASDIRSVMAKFNRVAKTTDTFAENINKLLDAGTKISKVIKKFNGIDTTAVETVKSNVAAKAQIGDVISANNDNSAKVATAAKDIENAGSNIEKAASKINTAADKTNKAADKEVKKANPLTTDNAQREYKSTSNKYSKAEEYYKKNVVGTKFEDADTIKYYEELVAAMSKATAAKAEFDKSGSADALVAYQIALRDAADAFKVFDTKLDLVRDHFSEVNTRLNNLGKSLNTRFTSLKENYAIVENLQAKASAKGYENLASRVVSDQFSDAFKEANNAVEKFNKDQSFENADNARAKLTALSVAIQAYRKELTEAESISKKAFEALPTKIEQVKSRIASLVEQQKKTTKDSKSYNILQEQIDNLTRLLNVLQQIDTNGSYSQFTDMFRQFQDIGDKNSITIKSLTSLLSAFGIEARDATSQVRNLNTELRNTRNINSWEKSMQNTMYTAQRYFNNNSKISTNTEAYARFVDFFNTYDEKIKSKMFTQENSSQMSKDWSELKKYIQDAGLETDKLSVKLKKLFEVNIKSQLANQVINTFQQGLRQVYQNVVDIDSAMTELKKVTDETSGAYSKFLSEAGDRAKNLGVSISDVVNATADFARLGYNLEDATQISDSAVMFKQVGDGVQSMDDATSDIISAMKAFNIEADKSLTITDRYNAVGNSFSITSAGVAEALKRSASSLHTAGNDIDQSIGMIVAANDVVQDPDSVGAGLRVIALRIRGATSELESMGEETDTVVKSTAKLQAEIKAISGVNILESDNATFKSTYQIMDELSAKWSQLSDIQKATLTDKIAGKNRANIFSSMMENWEDAKKAMETSKNSAGSATKELDTYLSSIEGKLSRFQATFQSFSSDVLDSGVVKGFIDMGTAALDFADGLVKAGDAMPTIATAFSAVASMTNTKAGVNMPTYATGIAA
jgi:TP901 family phage tail tape measure protein